MENPNILDEPVNTEKSISTTMEEITSIRINLEKLDGGYISDVKGTRKIYAKKSDVIEDIGINNILDGITHNEYRLHIDLVPKEKYEDYVDAMEFGIQVQEQKKSNAELTEELIEKNKFNPIKSESNAIDLNIKIDEKNCYTAARLKAIDWKKFHEEMPLTAEEKADIAGITRQNMYFTWSSIMKGKALFQVKKTRIAFTILAKFYEANLGVRSSTKEQNELLKDKMLKSIREIQLLENKSGFIQFKELAKKLAEMQKILLS